MIKIKRRILPLLISALLLTSCAEIPIGGESSQTVQEGSKIVLEPSGEVSVTEESVASEEASTAVSEQSNVTEEPSEEISGGIRSADSGKESSAVFSEARLSRG